MRLTQSGRNVSGTFNDELGSGPVSGTLSEPRRVQFTVRQANFQPFTMSGTVNNDLNRITGNTTGSGFTGQSFSMTR